MVPTSQKKDALSRSHVPFPIIIEILSLKKKKPETHGVWNYDLQGRWTQKDII